MCMYWFTNRCVAKVRACLNVRTKNERVCNHERSYFKICICKIGGLCEGRKKEKSSAYSESESEKTYFHVFSLVSIYIYIYKYMNRLESKCALRARIEF